jgi:hypothetical protein
VHALIHTLPWRRRRRISNRVAAHPVSQAGRLAAAHHDSRAGRGRCFPSRFSCNHAPLPVLR